MDMYGTKTRTAIRQLRELVQRLKSAAERQPKGKEAAIRRCADELAKFSGFEHWCDAVDEMCRLHNELAPALEGARLAIRDRELKKSAMLHQFVLKQEQYIAKGAIVEASYVRLHQEAADIASARERTHTTEDASVARLANLVVGVINPVGILIHKTNNPLWKSLEQQVEELEKEAAAEKSAQERSALRQHADSALHGYTPVATMAARKPENPYAPARLPGEHREPTYAKTPGHVPEQESPYSKTHIVKEGVVHIEVRQGGRLIAHADHGDFDHEQNMLVIRDTRLEGPLHDPLKLLEQQFDVTARFEHSSDPALSRRMKLAGVMNDRTTLRFKAS